MWVSNQKVHLSIDSIKLFSEEILARASAMLVGHRFFCDDCFKAQDKPVQSHQTIPSNPWHSFLCQQKEKVHCVVYALWDHFPYCILIFSPPGEVVEEDPLGESLPSLSTVHPPPLLLLPCMVTIHGSSQLRPIWVTREHSLGYHFHIQRSKNMPSYPHCYQAGIQYSDTGHCEPEDVGVCLHYRAHGQIYTHQLNPH